MKIDWPKPYTSITDPIGSEPGYRILGKGEILKKTDEVFSGTCHWTDTNQAGKVVGSDPIAFYTYRRALSVDDPYAPPPAQWVIPGYCILTAKDLISPTCVSDEYWWAAAGQWVKRSFNATSTGTFDEVSYYRRPLTVNQANPSSLANPMNIALSSSKEWIPFSTRRPTDAEAGAGIWTCKDGDPATVQLSKYCPGYSSYAYVTHWMPGADAYPTPPKPTLPPVPKVNGHSMTYAKGADIVVFGCAQIDIDIIRTAAKAMGNVVTDRGILKGAGICRSGNRKVRAITIDSGVSINRTEIEEILAYVDAVNKA